MRLLSGKALAATGIIVLALPWMAQAVLSPQDAMSKIPAIPKSAAEVAGIVDSSGQDKRVAAVKNEIAQSQQAQAQAMSASYQAQAMSSAAGGAGAMPTREDMQLLQDIQKTSASIKLHTIGYDAIETKWAQKIAGALQTKDQAMEACPTAPGGEGNFKVPSCARQVLGEYAGSLTSMTAQFLGEVGAAYPAWKSQAQVDFQNKTMLMQKASQSSWPTLKAMNLSLQQQLWQYPQELLDVVNKATAKAALWQHDITQAQEEIRFNKG